VSQLGAAPEKMVVYSDGCSSQYKSKGPFADLSLADIPISRNFFGSEHGKSACDAEIGVLNRAIDRAIIGKKVIINNTEDLFKFCEENLVLDEPFIKRNFIFVKGKEIPRERPETIVKPIPNSRKIHNMENTSVPYMIKTRNLSCFCIECMKGKSDNCLNSEYVSGYKLQKMTLVQNGSKEAKSKKEKKELTQSKKLKAKESSEVDIKKDSDVRTVCNQNSKQNQEAETRSKETKADNSRSEQNHDQIGVHIQVNGIEDEAKNTSIMGCKNYEELETLADQIQLPDIPRKTTEVSILTHKRTIDKLSLSLVPGENDLQDLFPCLIYGDGNCLPRCGSLFAYGTEEKHIEIRKRIVLHLVQHKEMYLNSNDARTFSMFSELFSGEVLSEIAVKPALVEALQQSGLVSKDFPEYCCPSCLSIICELDYFHNHKMEEKFCLGLFSRFVLHKEDRLI
jgi:hypothetical protein